MVPKPLPRTAHVRFMQQNGCPAGMLPLHPQNPGVPRGFPLQPTKKGLSINTRIYIDIYIYIYTLPPSLQLTWHLTEGPFSKLIFLVASNKCYASGREGIYLYRYWVGSLDFNFLVELISCFRLNPQKVIHFLQGGRCSNQDHISPTGYHIQATRRSAKLRKLGMHA